MMALPKPPRTVSEPARCADCVGQPACFFQQLPDECRHTMQPLLRERSFARGELLQRQGRMADSLQVIKVGNLVGRRQSVGGEMLPVAFVGRGQLLGAAALWGEASLLTCEALGPGRVCELARNQFPPAPQWPAACLPLLGRTQLQTWHDMFDWAHVARLKTVIDRVAGVLSLLVRVQRSPRVQLPEQVLLADLVGSSREAVGRALKQLEQQGRLRRVGRLYADVLSPSAAIYKGPARP